MNDHEELVRTVGMTESAFGRPASWWTAWPALAVGLVAFLMAAYGTWWLPKRLPAQYARALEQAQQHYQQVAENARSSGSQRLIDAAGDMDVIYSRLIDLEKNSPDRYWQWAEFQQAHAQRLNAALLDPALSLSPSIRDRWTEQAQLFQSKSEEIFEQLSVRPSELQATAILHVAHRRYRHGLGELGVREADKLAADVSKALDNTESAASEAIQVAAKLTTDEIDAGKLLLVQLRIEAAWLGDAPSKLTCDMAQLDQAWALLETAQSQQHSTKHELEWYATRRLLMAMMGKPLNSENEMEIGAALKSADRDATQDWKSQLAKLQLAAIDGAWTEVADLLRSRIGTPEPAVTSGLARTICRLATSPLAGAMPNRAGSEAEAGDVGPPTAEDSSRGDGGGGKESKASKAAERQTASRWADDASSGVLLAAQLGAHLPECSELLWECARLQAGQGTERPLVPAAIPQAIMSGQSGWLKHSLAALSATLDGQASVAYSHLQLLSRSQDSPPLVARVVLWRVQVLTAEQSASVGELNQQSLEELSRWRELLRGVVKLEPENGLNWFVLGTLQFQTGEFAAMRDSLGRASELLGDVPAIEQMLDAVDGIPSEL